MIDDGVERHIIINLIFIILVFPGWSWKGLSLCFVEEFQKRAISIPEG